jgi:hypothetical protein
MAGYVVADGGRSQTVYEAPAGWVGRKTIDNERRVSNSDETRGTQATLTLTFGGFVRACPTADGVVDGHFEYSLTSEVKTLPEPGQLVRRYSRHLAATLRGEVGDNARLKQIELFASWSIETREAGTPVSSQTIPVRQTFRPSSSGEPDWHAMQSAVASTADTSVAAVILWAGEFYKKAETNWTQPNECVRFAFDPPSDQLSLALNESAPVRVELHTKAGELPVPWETSNVQAIGGGTVSPRPARAPAGTATLTYTASARPRRGHGFELATTSRAGYATGQWRITDNDGRWSGTVSWSLTGSLSTTKERFTTTTTVTGSGSVTLEAVGGGVLKYTGGSATWNWEWIERYSSGSYMAGVCSRSDTQTRTRTLSSTSSETKGLVAIFDDRGGQLVFAVPGGPATGMSTTEATQTSTGPMPRCRPAAPTSIRDRYLGSAPMQTLTVPVMPGSNPNQLSGSTTVTVGDTPPHVYSVTWSFRR